jgi:hypothetical protein
MVAGKFIDHGQRKTGDRLGGTASGSLEIGQTLIAIPDGVTGISEIQGVDTVGPEKPRVIQT